MDLLKASPLIAIGIALMAAAPSGDATQDAIDVAVKERSNSFASLAASGRFAVVAWGASTADGAADVYVAASHDAGRAFGVPARVNRVAGEARLSGEQPPRVTLVPRSAADPAIVVVWTATSAAGTGLVSARSDDGGKSFAAAIPVPGSDGSGNRGWESISTIPDGSVAALWLDHREASSGGSGTSTHAHTEHQHPASGSEKTDGVARAQLSKLMFAKVGAAESARSLTGGVCYCCKTAMVTDAAGGIYAAWRHVYEGNVRDVAFTRSVDQGRTFAPPVRVSNDNWVLDGCPENGPAMTLDQANRIHIVWPTLIPGATPASEPTLALFHAMSSDGRRFSTRQRITTEGVPRHPQIVSGRRGELIIAWDEQARGTRRVAVARGTIDSGGRARFVRQSIDDSMRAEYPVLAAVSDGMLVAWTSGPAGRTTLRVRRLAD